MESWHRSAGCVGPEHCLRDDRVDVPNIRLDTAGHRRSAVPEQPNQLVTCCPPEITNILCAGDIPSAPRGPPPMSRRTAEEERAWQEVRKVVLRRDDWTCTECGERPQPTELDVHHLVPRAAGGADSASNCTTLCD